MTILVCELRLIVYYILVIVDLSMCKKKEKKEKQTSFMYYIVSLPIGHVHGCDTLFQLVYMMVRVHM